MNIPNWLFALYIVSPVVAVLFGFTLAYTYKHTKYLLYSFIYGLIVHISISYNWIITP